MRITKRSWGTGVFLFEIEGSGLHAAVSNYGGILQKLALRQSSGTWLDVVLGYDSLEEYQNSDTFFGAMIGPIADRMAGGRCVLDGKTVRLPLNAGPDSMHCADRGFHRALWGWEMLADGLRLKKTFEEAETGFPGALTVRLDYRIAASGTLRLAYAARCTRETAVSLTNHSYFNLGGGVGDCLGHMLTLYAGRYAETARNEDPICTGRALPVSATPLDFRGGARIGDAVSRRDFREIAVAGGVDHYFLTDGAGLRPQAILFNPENGLTLTCRSDAPGLLVYTANGLSDECGKGGARYGRNWGVCLETAGFPNAVNLPGWRDQVLLPPGETSRSVTEFEFRWG